MIPAILGIILNDEDARLFPKAAVTERLDNLAERKVIIGNGRSRCRKSRFGPAGMIVWKANQHQVGQVAGLFKLFEFFNELRRAEHVWHRHVPTDGISD